MNSTMIGIVKNRLFNFVFTFSIWLLGLAIFYYVGLFKNVNPDILLIVNLGAFFFALTTSPTTWIIKAFGIEIGSNTPNHFQVDKTIRGNETVIIVRDYDHPHDEKEINKILLEQSKK